jgi:pyrimidine-nucleoside phosphorylase
MKTRDDATALAQSLVRVGTANGLKTQALLTAMESPLGRYVGNAHEVIESIETLKGNGPADLTDLSVLLAARMVLLAGLAPDELAAKVKVVSALASGKGLEVFQKCIEQQGGDPNVIDDYSRLPTAPSVTFVKADRAGYVATLDAEKVGVAGMQLGAGRERAEDGVDHAVGIIVRAKPGERLKAGDVVFEVAYRDGTKLATAFPLLESAFAVADAPTAASPLVLQEIS